MAIPSRPKTNIERALDAPLLTFDLAEALRHLKAEDTWSQLHRNAITLLKNRDMRIVLMAAQRGVEMPSHVTQAAISVQVLEGQLELLTQSQTVTLPTGHMLTLQGGIVHRLLALEESAFLLTMSGIGE